MMKNIKCRLLLITFGLSLPLLSVSTACQSDQSAEKNGANFSGERSGSNGKNGAQQIDSDDFDPKCCKKRELDLNRDSHADAYQYYVLDEEGNPIIIRKEVDVNFDKYVDLIRTFDKKGNLVLERIDADFDRRIDFVNIFEDGRIVRKEYDTNFDGSVDIFSYYVDDLINRKEIDMNYDGKIDYWEYFEGGKIDRSGIDLNHDGKVDEWKTVNTKDR